MHVLPVAPARAGSVILKIYSAAKSRTALQSKKGIINYKFYAREKSTPQPELELSFNKTSSMIFSVGGNSTILFPLH
jgi:hypothetical protein